MRCCRAAAERGLAEHRLCGGDPAGIRVERDGRTRFRSENSSKPTTRLSAVVLNELEGRFTSRAREVDAIDHGCSQPAAKLKPRHKTKVLLIQSLVASIRNRIQTAGRATHAAAQRLEFVNRLSRLHPDEGGDNFE